MVSWSEEKQIGKKQIEEKTYSVNQKFLHKNTAVMMGVVFFWQILG